MNTLQIDSVVKSFGYRPILTDIYLKCDKGEIIGLLGRNGCGKSTLLKIIFGSLNSENKFVRVGNKKTHTISDSKHKISYLPQDSFLPKHIKVKTVINSFCNKKNAARIKAHPFFNFLLDSKITALSSGERRLLEIWLIVLSEVDYVLIDEPFNGIAPLYKKEIKNLILEESKNKGFIITDHDYENIINLSSRLLLIHDGGTKEINSREELERWNYLPSAPAIQ